VSHRLLVLDDDPGTLSAMREVALRLGAGDVIGKPARLARLRQDALRAMKKP
jgi:hypothetical protein